MKRFITLLCLCVAIVVSASAQEKKGYQFTDGKVVKGTSVKNQFRSGTCWCFSALSFLENEEPSALGFRLTAPDSTQEIYVLINGEREAVSFSVPQGEYTILANGEKVCPKGLSTLNIGSENSLSLQPIEALILLRK